MKAPTSWVVSEFHSSRKGNPLKGLQRAEREKKQTEQKEEDIYFIHVPHLEYNKVVI